MRQMETPSMWQRARFELFLENLKVKSQYLKVKGKRNNTSLSVGKMNPKYALAYLPYDGEVRKIMKPIPVLEHLILWNMCFRSTQCLSTRCFA